jgi:hypothetical protein
MMIGKLIKSNTHTDYVCQIYGPNEVKSPPSPTDYGFGNFVRLPLDAEDIDIIGIIYDTQLHNPDFGNLGPRLSPASDLKVFSPDYLTEKVTLLGIAAVGTMKGENLSTHGVPLVSAQIDTMVECMSDEAVKAFHSKNPGGIQMGYIPLLLGHNSSVTRYLILQIINRLRVIFPEQRNILAVLQREISWQNYIYPTGGKS